MTITSFKEQTLGIVTMHNKESILKPILEMELGMTVFLVPNLNTDQFGTFNNEIKRAETALETLRQKCKLGHSLMTNQRFFLASEGSFGNHPTLFFAQANEELIMLKDFELNQEFIGRSLSTETNYNSLKTLHKHEVIEFAQQVGFPEHGIMLRSTVEDQTSTWFKDFKDMADLENMLQDSKPTFYELITDMRAHRNPTRRKVIRSACQDLTSKLKSSCPSCTSIYFIINRVIPGLPCGNCSLPTKASLTQVKTCWNCQYEEHINYPHGKKFEDPTYCDYCNP